MSTFSHLKDRPIDPILGLAAVFNQDKNPNKLNLAVGVYKTEDSQVKLFECVHEAERLIFAAKRGKGYLPIDGDSTFKAEALKLIFGEYDPKSVYALQSVGCTSALRTTGDLLKSAGIDTIYLPDQTWQNHYLLFSLSGLDTQAYPYYDSVNKKIRMQEIRSVLENAPENSAVLFQVSCHNPVGHDLSKEEWAEIVELIQEKKLFPILDSAYHGLGRSLEEDIYAAKLYQEKFDQFILCYSFSKNFGLYGERTGICVAVDRSQQFGELLGKNFRHFSRGTYSCPPLHGSRIVTTILQSEELTKMWKEELGQIRKRLSSLRANFVNTLKAKGITHNYQHVLEDMGLFSLMGLNKEQVLKLRHEYGVYLVENGRINIAALTSKNVDYVAESLHQVVM